MKNSKKKNPIYKRLPRDLKAELGKYIALFLFMCLLCGFISGYMIANGSMTKTLDGDYERYTVENGHYILGLDEIREQVIKESLGMLPDLGESEGSIFTWALDVYKEDFSDQLDEQFRKKAVDIKKDVEDLGTTVEDMFYKDKPVTKGKTEGDTVRVFKPRESFNKVCVMEGRLPEADDEIAIDRLYAENNDIAVGDEIDIDGEAFRIVGTAALSDYSTMYKTNYQLMFDANHFSIAIVTDNAWNRLSESGIVYCYSWRNNDQTLDDQAQRDKADEIRDKIIESGLVTDFVARQDNQAIMFARDDISGDVVMMKWLFYITMGVMAFVYAASAKSTIEKDAQVIGTLRASGYTKRELLTYYISLPMIVTFAGAVVGTILGYTVLKYTVVMAYYHSYSLPTYTTAWNGEALLLTAVAPMVLIFFINFIIIGRALRFTPLQFLRKELSSGKSRNAVRLPLKWSFPARFRARIIIQSKGAYITMFFGVFLAAILLVFGTMMTPVMDHFRGDVLKSKFSEYQYVLKVERDTRTADAEKYCYGSAYDDINGEDVVAYGFKRDSAYFTGELPAFEPSKESRDKAGSNYENDRRYEVLASTSYMEKYGLKVGDELDMSEKFGKHKYKFVIADAYDYPASLAIFMDLDQFREAFDEEDDYYTGYLSNTGIDDIDDVYIATVITEKDLTLTADQLEDSMSGIFWMFGAFATILFVLLIYLLSRITIERNTYSISMVKILGYSEHEISALYNRANGIVAISSLIISMFLGERVIKIIWFAMMVEYPGWLTYYVAPSCFVKLLALGLACYFLVSALMMKRIKSVPMADALKGLE